MNNSRKKYLSLTELKKLLVATMIGCIFPGGIAASVLSGAFGAMLFSRDLLRMMLDLMQTEEWRPLCRQMFSVLPQWQGVKFDDATNESPDAFQHQVFLQINGGIQLPDELVDNVEFWTGKWGVKLQYSCEYGKHFVVYNSSDAPALYVVALAEFIRLTGDASVLKDRFYHRLTGEMRNVAEAASRCLDFISRQCLVSESKGLGGLYAVANTNPHQTSPTGKLEDGFDAVLRPVWDTNGNVTAAKVDYDFAAYIDHQSLAVWALELGATKLFPNDERATQWLRTAQAIREETLRTFWMGNTFGVAVDKDGLSKLETVAALETLNGTMLKTVKNAPDYVRAMTRWSYSPEVITPVGPVMTSRRFLPMWMLPSRKRYGAYQGPESAWPVRTNTVVTAFDNWGLPLLVHDMGFDRNVGLFRRSGMALEATYVEPTTNTPLYNPLPGEQDVEAADIVIYPSSPPQPGQGWSASSGIRQLEREENESMPQRAPAGTWQHNLETEMAGRIEVFPPASAMIDGPAVAADYEKGEELKEEFRARLGLSA